MNNWKSTTPSITENQSSVEQEISENNISQKLNPKDISMENASYIENNLEVENRIRISED